MTSLKKQIIGRSTIVAAGVAAFCAFGMATHAKAATCDELKQVASVIETQVADIKAGKVQPRAGFDRAASAALAIASADNQARIRKVSDDLGASPTVEQVFGAFREAEKVMLAEAGKIGGQACKR